MSTYDDDITRQTANGDEEICTKEDTLNDMVNYGPNPKIMANILEQSNFILSVSSSQRTLMVSIKDRLSSAEPSPGYKERPIKDNFTEFKSENNEKCILSRATSRFFEDELVQLFNDDKSEIYELLLMMDQATDMSKGCASITYAQKEDAELVQRKMLIEISSLKAEIEDVEQITDKEKVDQAKETNKLQSLQMENIKPDEKSLKKIIDASDYAINHMDNITLKHILEIHRKVAPDIEEVGMFRNYDIFINGIYDIPVYPSPVDEVVPEMKAFVSLLSSTQNVGDKTAIIMAVTAKTNFLIAHPFFDGNGRCSRAIFSAMLRKRNYPWIVIPVLDSTRYYEALKFALQDEDFALIYRFLCRCIRRTLLAYMKNLRS